MAVSRLAGRGAGFSPAAIGIHIGVILITLGISFSGPYKMEEELTFTANGSAKLGAYTISMKKLNQGEEPGYEYLEPVLEVQKNGKVLGVRRKGRMTNSRECSSPRWTLSRASERKSTPRFPVWTAAKTSSAR